MVVACKQYTENFDIAARGKPKVNDFVLPQFNS